MSASDVNRLFLQAVLSRQTMPQSLAKTLCKNAIQAVNSVNEGLGLVYSSDFYGKLIGEINRALEPLSLEFRQMMSEEDGQPVCAIINLKGDEVAQLATQYSATEIAYFKLIVEQIMLAPNETFCIPSMSALQELNNLPTKSLTKAQAESLLSSFVANGWLNLSPKGRYTLSSRSIMELQPYLKSTYEDELLECTTCFEIVTRGISCYTPNCKCRLHNHCYKLHMNTRQTCPSCQADWSPNAPRVKKVGEEAAGKDDFGSSKSSRRRRAPQRDDEPEPESEEEANGGQQQPMDEDEDDEEEAQRPTKGKGKERASTNRNATQTARTASSSSNKKGKGRRVPDSDDEEDEEEPGVRSDEDEEEEPIPAKSSRRSKRS